jgi:hypothetical protein
LGQFCGILFLERRDILAENKKTAKNRAKIFHKEIGADRSWYNSCVHSRSLRAPTLRSTTTRARRATPARATHTTTMTPTMTTPSPTLPWKPRTGSTPIRNLTLGTLFRRGKKNSDKFHPWLMGKISSQNVSENDWQHF